MDFQIFIAETGHIKSYMKTQKIEFYEAMQHVLMNLDEKQKDFVDQDILIPSFSKSYCVHQFDEITDSFKKKDEDHILNVTISPTTFLKFQQAYSAV